MNDTQQLLAEYVKAGSEAAFREIVERYINLVYAAAIRQVGDPHLAQDVAQTVFVDLARKAGTLPADILLGGWLHRHTCFIASSTVRSERRRQSRERQAVEMNAIPDHSDANLAQVTPILDDAINQLGAEDRSAILLRFFEQRDFRSVGVALGSNEDAARMRVTRALEKLHALLKHRGVSLSVAAMGTILASEAAAAAPAGLAAAISGTALATAAAATGTTLTLVKLLTMTNLKIAFASTLVVAAAAATPLAIQHQNQARLNRENTALRQQADQLAPLQAEVARLSNQVAAQQNLAGAPADSSGELLKLRGEVARLRGDSQELSRMKAARSTTAVPGTIDDVEQRVALLKQHLALMPDRKIPELQYLTDDDWKNTARKVQTLESDDDYRMAFGHLRAAAKKTFALKLSGAWQGYFNTSGQMPTDLAQMKPYFAEAPDDAVFSRYELKQGTEPQTIKTGSSGSGDALISPDSTLIAAEKAPVDDQYDTLFSIRPNGYTFKSVGALKIGGGYAWSNSSGASPKFVPDENGIPHPSAGGGSGGGAGTGTGFRIVSSNNVRQVTNTKAGEEQ